jgi:hypothetical protein
MMIACPAKEPNKSLEPTAFLLQRLSIIRFVRAFRPLIVL